MMVIGFLLDGPLMSILVFSHFISDKANCQPDSRGTDHNYGAFSKRFSNRCGWDKN